MSRRNLFLILFSLGAGFLVCLFLGVFLLLDGGNLYARAQRILAQQPEQVGTMMARTQVASVSDTPTASATASPTVTPSPRCGGPPVMFLVLLGTDSRANSYQAGLADSIRLVRVDFIDPDIMVLPFQRDLYVEIPGIEEHGITHGKLNQGYTYGTPAFGYFDAPNQGLGLMELTMEHNFGVHVDYGVVVNMQSFVRIVDALGGIDIDLPNAIDGRVPGSRDPALYFPAGPQHLDGLRTQILARVRPQGDLERTDTQTLILQALSEKLLSPALFSKLPELVNTFREAVYSDLGPEEIAQLTCLALRLDPQKIKYVNFPPSFFIGSRMQDPVLGYTFIFDTDFNLLRGYVADFVDKRWPGEALMTPAPMP